MKTINQEVQVLFNCIEIKDAIKMCPIMDAIINKMQEWEEYNSLSTQEKAGKESPANSIIIQNLNYKNLDALLAMLQNLGFCTSY